MQVRNVFVIFIVSGFWHGANWTFIAWGALNALYFLPLLLSSKNRINTDCVAQGKLIPTWKEVAGMLTTFTLTIFGWILFRSETIDQAKAIFSEIFSFSLFAIPNFQDMESSFLVIALTLLFLFVEWLGREQQYALAQLGQTWKKPLRYTMYYLLIIALFWFGGKDQQFLYFQF